MEWNGPVEQVGYLLVARLSISFFLLPAASGKLLHYRRFVEGVIDYQVLPSNISRVVGWVVPWVEIYISLALISGFRLSQAGLFASFLFLSFMVAIALNLSRGRAIDCNCFSLAGTNLIGWGTVARNALLFIMASTVAFVSSQGSMEAVRASSWEAYKLLVDGFTSVPLITLLGFSVVLILLVEWGIEIRGRNRLLMQSGSFGWK